MAMGWVMKTPGVISQSNRRKLQAKIKKRNVYQVQRKLRLALFLQGLDKMESHYCRSRSKKMYIAATFRSKEQLFQEYRKYCSDNGYGQAASYFLFSTVFDKENLALFKPKKDQCDTCVGYKAKQVTRDEYVLHVERQKRAKAEKELDKNAAIQFGRHVFTGDTQAVKLSPDLNASAVYFKTRLQVHNYTIYNLSTHQCTNYCAHAKIENKLENCSIFVPNDYVNVTKTARKTVTIDGVCRDCPYDVEYLTHDFFKNYADAHILRFNSIRPGTKTGDPTVTQLRAMIYLPSGEIMYKTDFDADYRLLPQKITRYNSAINEPKQLHSESLKITKSKYEHLQQLKAVIPAIHHSFYDKLKHQ
ncbi:hypothetical protein HA402_004181 [Bradysia odoriphaga]|nr:hypothetical protein HA402_004181 [Bradysia odoriphaga]